MVSIEALIRLAVDNGLSLLEVGDVKIVPGPRRLETLPDLKIVREEEARLGKKLTAREKEDIALFGAGASLRSDDE